MNERLKRGAWIFIPAVFVVLILAMINVWAPEAPVAADAPPPMLPEFSGEPFTAQLGAEQIKLLNQQPISVPQEATGWSLVLSETFTTTLDSEVWTTVDNNGATDGEYYWATGVYSNTGMSDLIARSISGGADGISVTVTEGYTANVDSWLIMGPFSVEAANEAVVTFDYWFDAAQGDYFGVAVSTNGGVTYEGRRQNGGLGQEWHGNSFNLNDVVGETAVYVAFIFMTDGSTNTQNRLGAYLDDINLYMRYSLNTYMPFIKKDFTPTPTNTPTPTFTPTPTNTPVATNTPTPSATPTVSINYRDDFDDSDTGWEMRRTDITNTSNWDVIYTSEEELQINVDVSDSYVIASPLVALPERPYNIEVKARFTNDSEDRHIYGIVFAANWNGSNCPSSNYSTCFNRYYLLRVEFDETNAGSPYLEYMLRRIYSHDSNNNPQSVDILGWKKLNNAAPTGWHEWDILVDSDGDISISFDDNLLTTVTGDTGLDAHYFGVLGETNDTGEAVVRFDYYKVDAIP